MADTASSTAAEGPDGAVDVPAFEPIVVSDEIAHAVAAVNASVVRKASITGDSATSARVESIPPEADIVVDIPIDSPPIPGSASVGVSSRSLFAEVVPRALPAMADSDLLAIRVFFDISSSLNDELARTSIYKSFKVTEETTFKQLFKVICDRMSISEARSVYYKLTLRSYNFTYSQRLDHDPPMHSKVVDALNRMHLQAHSGSVALYFLDARKPRHRRIDLQSAANSSSTNSSSSSGANGGNTPGGITSQQSHMNALTSFSKRNLAIEFFGKYEQIESQSMPYAVLSELESIAVKRARLMKQMRCKEGTWRETQVYLDGHRLWISKGGDGYPDSTGLPSPLSYFDLSLPVQVDASIIGGNRIGSATSSTCTVTYNEAECSLDITDAHEGVTTTLKAKSRVDLSSWRSAINARTELASESNLIYMADEHVTSYESYREDLNFRALPYLKGLSGTLSHKLLRTEFRNYLENAGDEMLLKFWEYCEDFRRFHPDSRLPYLGIVDDVDAAIELFTDTANSGEVDISNIHSLSQVLSRRMSARKMSTRISQTSGESASSNSPQCSSRGKGASTAWPHKFKYSVAESNALGKFIHTTFLSDAKSFADIMTPSELSKIRLLVSKSLLEKFTIPRTTFIKVQRNALKEIRRIFLSDFSRSYKYRLHCTMASMDKQACKEAKRTLSYLHSMPLPTLNPPVYRGGSSTIAPEVLSRRRRTREMGCVPILPSSSSKSIYAQELTAPVRPSGRPRSRSVDRAVLVRLYDKYRPSKMASQVKIWEAENGIVRKPKPERSGGSTSAASTSSTSSKQTFGFMAGKTFFSNNSSSSSTTSSTAATNGRNTSPTTISTSTSSTQQVALGRGTSTSGSGSPLTVTTTTNTAASSGNTANNSGGWMPAFLRFGSNASSSPTTQSALASTSTSTSGISNNYNSSASRTSSSSSERDSASQRPNALKVDTNTSSTSGGIDSITYSDAFKHPAFDLTPGIHYNSSNVPWMPNVWWGEVGKAIDKFIEATERLPSSRASVVDSVQHAASVYDATATWVPNATTIDGLLKYVKKAASNIATVSVTQALPLQNVISSHERTGSRKFVGNQEDTYDISSSSTSTNTSIGSGTITAALVSYVPSYCKTRYLQQKKDQHLHISNRLSVKSVRFSGGNSSSISTGSRGGSSTSTSSSTSSSNSRNTTTTDPLRYSHTDCSSCRTPRPSSSFQVPPTLLHKALACEEYREVFASRVSNEADGSSSGTSTSGGSNVAKNLGIKKPQNYLNTGANIFFNRRPDAAAVGYKGRHHALHEGKLIGVAQGQLVTSVFPLPYNSFDIPGSVLLTYQMRGRYMRYAPAYLVSELTATTTFYSSINGGTNRSSTTYGMDHLDIVDGYTERASIANSPSSNNANNGNFSDARITAPVVVQDGELDTAEALKYVTYLVDVGNNHLQLHLYSPINQATNNALNLTIGGAPATLQRKAIIHLNSLAQISVGLMDSINLFDDRGLLFCLVVEACDEDDAHVCTKRWFDVVNSVLGDPSAKKTSPSSTGTNASSTGTSATYGNSNTATSSTTGSSSPNMAGYRKSYSLSSSAAAANSSSSSSPASPTSTSTGTSGIGTSNSQSQLSSPITNASASNITTSASSGPRVVYVLHQDHLSKRGQINTAFRRRWFVLTSDDRLRYYKEDSGQYKGEISLRHTTKMEVSDKEITISLHNRVYVLLADSLEGACRWAVTLSYSIDRAKSSSGANFDDAALDDLGDD